MIRLPVLLLAVTVVAGCASSVERQADDAKRRLLIDTNVQLAANYLQRGQLEFAQEKLEKALAIDADNPSANSTMALLQWRLKNDAAAEQHFQKAVSTANGHGEAHNNYGAFLCERGRVKQAVERFRQAVDDPLYPTPAVAYQNAGLCLVKAGEATAAEQQFREALRLDPQLPPSLEHMARLSLDGGRALAARGFMQRYFQAATDTPAVLWLAVRIEHALGHKDQAASYGLRLRAKFPESPEAKHVEQLIEAGRG